jgi:hypothetical protein
LNRYGRVDNQEVNYQTHTFNSYLSSTQFLQFVTARITGKKLEDEFKSYHLARQFNELYMNWEETKKNSKQYMGKTPSYMLDAYGFDEANLDVTVRMDLSIKGTMLDNRYLWTVIFKTKFGRKLKEDRWVNGDWLSCGNVYNSYPDDFLKNYADPLGYLIRDHSIISMANTYVKSLKCDSIILRSTPFSLTEFEEETEHKLKQRMLYKMHQKEYDKLPKTLYEFFGNHWHSGEPVKYFENWSSNKQEHHMREDTHPRSTVYANYLESIGIKLSEKTHQLAKESDKILALSDTKIKLIENFKWVDPQNRLYFRVLT